VRSDRTAMWRQDNSLFFFGVLKSTINRSGG
jgi:hypothetical protein